MAGESFDETNTGIKIAESLQALVEETGTGIGLLTAMTLVAMSEETRFLNATATGLLPPLLLSFRGGNFKAND